MKEASVPVDVEHAKCLDAVLAKNPLLARIHVAQADVHELPHVDEVIRLQPAEVLGLLLLREAGYEADGHPVDVAGAARLGRVDVGVCVYPDDGHLPTEPLAHGLGGTGDGANGDGVIAAQGQDHSSFLGVRVDLVAKTLGDAAHGLGVLHVSEGRVFSRNKVFIRVYRVVAMELVVELVPQLGEQAGLDQGRGGCIDTWFALRRMTTANGKQCVVWGRIVVLPYLTTGETNGYNAEVLGVREKLGLDHGSVHCRWLPCLGYTPSR